MSDKVIRLSGTLQGVGTLKGTLTKEEKLKGNLANEVLRGYSAYQVAVLNGFEGTEQEWLASLKAKAVLVNPLFNDDGEGNVTYDVNLFDEVANENEEGNLKLASTPINGTTDYDKLKNKPKINGVELQGDVSFEELGLIGSGLKYDNETKKLSVNVTNDVEQDNTLPITSASVYETVGNIQELLKTI